MGSLLHPNTKGLSKNRTRNPKLGLLVGLLEGLGETWHQGEKKERKRSTFLHISMDPRRRLQSLDALESSKNWRFASAFDRGQLARPPLRAAFRDPGFKRVSEFQAQPTLVPFPGLSGGRSRSGPPSVIPGSQTRRTREPAVQARDAERVSGLAGLRGPSPAPRQRPPDSHLGRRAQGAAGRKRRARSRPGEGRALPGEPGRSAARAGSGLGARGEEGSRAPPPPRARLVPALGAGASRVTPPAARAPPPRRPEEAPASAPAGAARRFWSMSDAGVCDRPPRGWRSG
ncbi:uncharacterized protein LOC142440053 [Tenrec ecaudatus]|uniref:uncharacterized protein LOC142440053 n=1 Tax=Tenrec ecaudatus TaxID=94439 RepID=UPI003F5A6A64